jgi:probable F420-dependent oxidoreductase
MNTSQRPLRFGASVSPSGSKQEWMALVRTVEGLGYSTVQVPEHVSGQFALGPALAMAAEATHTVRLGSFVFNNTFRHPVLLAKEAATLDVLSDGRFELGIGAGGKRAEYEQAGVAAYDAPGVCIAKLEETLRICKALFAEGPLSFAGKYYTVTNFAGDPKPVQRPHPPILSGGNGQRILSLAAREASIVSFSPHTRPDGTGMGLLNETPEALAQRVTWVRQAAGARFTDLELNIHIADVVVTDDREQVAHFLTAAQTFGAGVTPAQLLASPYALLGTVDQICEQVLALRERYGISYLTVSQPQIKAFAPVIARLL